ncbi:LemA family protein [Methylomarinum sp. Ch1-1]|uniref:LemA family protein n=1 Tax=Methylomarinum roseum TaxID=3067653 RepID=A0AAU7NV96_9GAMM|nr:LemA family protein [Methylomarinum sp. Ch1-1]MDP4519340.1 LemA family protein [Methylomarinum sp. Ch1-1]
MLVFSAVFFGIIALLIIYVIVTYNGLVSLKHNTAKAWSNIDVLLKQRHDELPKLVEVCKQYMQFEQTTLEKVIQARAGIASAQEHGDIKALGAAETQLRQGLSGLFAVAEAYPELKANQSFQQLQQRITALENDIAFRREFYNESANQNNIRIEQFPDLIIARLSNFQAFDLLEFSETETQDVDVESLFNA